MDYSDYLRMHPVKTLSGNAPCCAQYLIILLYLTPDNFTCQGESAATYSMLCWVMGFLWVLWFLPKWNGDTVIGWDRSQTNPSTYINCAPWSYMSHMVTAIQSPKPQQMNFQSCFCCSYFCNSRLFATPFQSRSSLQYMIPESSSPWL
jgi:hypothetical protein